MSKFYIRLESHPTNVVAVCIGEGDKPELKFLQEQVGGYIERVSLPKLEAEHVDMYVNDEALLTPKPLYNYSASRLANEENGVAPTKENCYGYFICGNAVIIGSKETTEGVESAWLDKDQVDKILKALHMME